MSLVHINELKLKKKKKLLENNDVILQLIEKYLEYLIKNLNFSSFKIRPHRSFIFTCKRNFTLYIRKLFYDFNTSFAEIKKMLQISFFLFILFYLGFIFE